MENLTASQKEIISNHYLKRYKTEQEDTANSLYNVISTYGRKKHHLYGPGRIRRLFRISQYNIKKFVGEIILEPLIDCEIKIDSNQDLLN